LDDVLIDGFTNPINRRRVVLGHFAFDDFCRWDCLGNQLLDGETFVTMRTARDVRNIRRHGHTHQAIARNAIAQNHRTFGLGAGHGNIKSFNILEYDASLTDSI
jgi:hypothetical protein